MRRTDSQLFHLHAETGRSYARRLPAEELLFPCPEATNPTKTPIRKAIKKGRAD